MKFSMSKVLIAILLICTLIDPVLSGRRRGRGGSRRRKNRHKRSLVKVFRHHPKGNSPPNIRKCLTIRCKEGYECFLGKCIKRDDSCATVLCSVGYRCVDGKCIPRKHQPKKMICTPLGFQLKKQKCKDIKDQCLANPSCFAPQETCGFHSRRRMYKDFASPCEACLDNTFKIRFYYDIACEDAPRICS